MALSASEIDKHVGTRMRMRREALGVSQGRLGQYLGLTFSQVQKYEKGTNRIGAGRLYLLAQHLGVPIEYFYDGLGESKPEKNIGACYGATDGELVSLSEAFLAIPDSDTRRSVVALVRSLMGPHIAPIGIRSDRPRRLAGGMGSAPEHDQR